MVRGVVEAWKEQAMENFLWHLEIFPTAEVELSFK